MIGSYRFRGGEEYCLAFDRKRTGRVMLIAPLFDEANRTRRLLVATMRHLDAIGVDSFLPDLPGQNESRIAQQDADPALWREALAACAAEHGISHVASLRGGALVDHFQGAERVWRLAPAKGAQLLRTMIRTRIASDKESGISASSSDLMDEARAQGIELAGNMLSPAMIAGLEQSVPEERLPVHLARLEGDSQSADSHIPGSPLWLRAEPGEDPAMAEAMARDIAGWLA